jgi:hypothetical protein
MRSLELIADWSFAAELYVPAVAFELAFDDDGFDEVVADQFELLPL